MIAMVTPRGHLTGNDFEGIRGYDLIQLGIAADERLRARRGQRVTYVRVQEISSFMITAIFSVPALPGIHISFFILEDCFSL